MRNFLSHGDGSFTPDQLQSIGPGIIFEEGVKIWHPETVSIGTNTYIGHHSLLKGHPQGKMTIGENTWIGQEVFFHSAGNLRIGNEVGIGPRVMILTSSHEEAGRNLAILHSPLKFAPVVIEDHADIGIGAIVLPGVTVGKGAQVGAGSVVTKNVPAYAVVAGNPARILRIREI